MQGTQINIEAYQLTDNPSVLTLRGVIQTLANQEGYSIIQHKQTDPHTAKAHLGTEAITSILDCVRNGSHASLACPTRAVIAASVFSSDILNMLTTTPNRPF